jgi:hypothetical protein
VLKKALDQYKHQIANLTQELDILRSRMRKAGIIQDAHSVLPHSATNGGIGGDSGSGDETLKAFEAEQARMVESEAKLGLQSKAENGIEAGSGTGTGISNGSRKVVAGNDADSLDSDSTNASSRDSLQRLKAEAEAAAATRAIN